MIAQADWKKIAVILVFLAVGISGTVCRKSDTTGADQAQNLFKNRKSLTWLHVEGTVHRVLADDMEGSRHQRIIIRTEHGQTILVVHNIDIAPRVPVNEGTRLKVSGEYIWNSRGGKIHYTHTSTSKWKRSGYIRDLETGKNYR